MTEKLATIYKRLIMTTTHFKSFINTEAGLEASSPLSIGSLDTLLSPLLDIDIDYSQDFWERVHEGLYPEFYEDQDLALSLFTGDYVGSDIVDFPMLPMSVIARLEEYSRIRSYYEQLDKISYPCNIRIKTEIQNGKYIDIEMNLYDKLIKMITLEAKKKFKNNSQMDMLGLNRVTDSIGLAVTAASDIKETLERCSDKAADKMERLNQTFTMAFENLMPEVVKITNKGVDVNHNHDLGVSGFFTMLEDPQTATLMICVTYLFVEFISRRYDVPEFVYIKGLIAAYAAFRIGPKIYNLFSSWFVSKTQTAIYRAEADWTDWLQVAVQGVLFVIFGCTLNIASLYTTVKSLGEAAANAARLQDLFGTILEWFKKVTTMVVETLGFEAFEWMKPQDLKIREFVGRVAELNAIHAKDPMNVNIKFVEDTNRLLLEINNYQKTINVSSKNQPVSIAIKSLLDKMAGLQKMVTDAGLNMTDRGEPLLATIAGAAGCGKTYWSKFATLELAMDNAKDDIERAEYASGKKRSCYSWPLENKHHDQYKGEYITLYPDLFTSTDAEGMPSEASYLIYLIGDQPVTLAAADLTLKQKLQFISQVVLACTNVVYINDTMFKSIRNPGALRRRVNECGYYMWVNPKYAVTNPDGSIVMDHRGNKLLGYEDMDELYAMIDNNKFDVRDPPSDLHQFRKLDFTKGTFCEDRVYNTEQFNQLLIKAARAKRENAEIKRENINAYAMKLLRRAKPQAETEIGYTVVEARVIPERIEPVSKPFRRKDRAEMDESKLELPEILRDLPEALDDCAGLIPLDDFSLTEEQYHQLRFKASSVILELWNLKLEEFAQVFSFGYNIDRTYQVERLSLLINALYGHPDLAWLENGNGTYSVPVRATLDMILLPYDMAYESVMKHFIDEKTTNPYLRALNYASCTWKSFIMFAKGKTVTIHSKVCSLLPDFVGRNMETILATLAGSAVVISICVALDIFLSSREVPKIQGSLQETIAIAKVPGAFGGQSDFSDSDVVSNMIDGNMKNFCVLRYFIWMDKGYHRHPCNVIFIGGEYAIMVNHAAEAISKMFVHYREKGIKTELQLENFTSNNFADSTERCGEEAFSYETTPQLKVLDLCVARFKGVNKRGFMFNFIPPLDVLSSLFSEKNKNIEGTFLERTTDHNKLCHGPPIKRNVAFNWHADIRYPCAFDDDGIHYELDSRKYDGLSMTGRDKVMKTFVGYCSSPGFITDPRKNFYVNKGWKQAQQPWLAYVHTSMSGFVPCGSAIYRELFTKWIDELKGGVIYKAPVEAIKENMEIYEDVVTEVLEIPKKDRAEGNFQIYPCDTVLDPKHVAFAVSNMKLNVPHKSGIERTPLFGIEELTRYPSRFGICNTKDGKVDTMQLARTPCGVNSVLLDIDHVDQIVHQAMARVFSKSSVPKYRNVLDFDQCVYGDSAYYLPSTNWDSSAGFFFRSINDQYKLGWKRKDWMAKDGKMYPQAEQIVHKLFDIYDAKLQAGERIYSMNIDNLKDELLKKEKVDKGISRLFCSNDYIALLLAKKYTGAFAGWIFENRITNGIAIGMNPVSSDWDAMVRNLWKTSKKMIFLDHKQFDKDQLRRIMRCILILMDMYYGDAGSIFSRCREALLEDVFNSIHVTMHEGKMYFYCWDQGNTSGNFWTAILNSLVNQCYCLILAIYAWLEHQGINPRNLRVIPDNPANEAIDFIILGDDLVMAVNDILIPGVTFNTIRDCGKRYLNITITDELKSTGECPDFREIHEGSFLGRGIVPEEIGGVVKWLAPLRPYSCWECVQWRKGRYDPMIEVAKIERMNLELSYHPRALFEAKVPRYAEACHSNYGVYPRFTNYDIARKYMLTISEYKYTFGNYIVEDDEFMGHSLSNLLIEQSKKSLQYYQVDNDYSGFTAINEELTMGSTALGELECI